MVMWYVLGKHCSVKAEKEIKQPELVRFRRFWRISVLFMKSYET